MQKIRCILFAWAVFAVAPAGALADTCNGSCGTLGANGVVTASPFSPDYQFISTNDAVVGAGVIASVGNGDPNPDDPFANGSEYLTGAFTAAAGDKLEFYFNYVTSDGSGFADYSFAELLTGASAHVAWLFTARTQPTANTSPGFGLPANSATLDPATTEIIPGGPAWAPLGGSSGDCFADGCGYTGWIHSTYTIADAGQYILRFGVTNWFDELYQSGLAFDGATIAGAPIGEVPEPGTVLLLISALGAMVAYNRRRKSQRASL